MVSLVCAKIGASGVVWVVAGRRMGGGGLCGSELLLLLLLEQIVVPVVLLPLCVHDDEVPAGTRVKTIASSCLSKLKKWRRKQGKDMYAESEGVEVDCHVAYPQIQGTVEKTELHSKASAKPK